MTTGQKQEEFSRCLALLLVWLYLNGYRVRMGHVFRCPDCPVGHKKSCHKSKLAVDLSLFMDGQFLTETIEYQRAGEYWESLHPLARWGGSWNDGNHFSFEHGGVR